MYGAAGPALTYGVGVPAASNAAGIDPSTTYDALTPNAVQSAALGFMTAKHSTGLQSGGMVGYSTFFTGYDPETDGTARQLSMGRLGGQAVSASARGLLHTPLAANETARGVLERLTLTSRYGLGGALSAGRVNEAERAKMMYGSVGNPTGGKVMDVARARSQQAPAPVQGVRQGKTPMHTPKTRVKSALIRGNLSQGSSLTSAGDDVAEELLERQRRSSVGGNIYKWITGVLGGSGYNKDGELASEVVQETVGDNTYNVAKSTAKGTHGANVLKGAAGRAAGFAFKAISAYEIAQIGADAVSYAAGEGYKSMVEATTRLQRRVGADNSMSGGYFNRAAATERQRAMRTMQENKLAPRTQVRGNEAYYMHR